MGQGRFGTTPSRRRQQDLAGPLQLPDCTLQRLGPGLIVARHPGSLPGVHFRAGHPPRSVSGLTPTRVPIRLTAAVTDLGVAAIGQRDMGEVGLPALVRQVTLDPDPGPLGPVARVRAILRRGSGSARSSSRRPGCPSRRRGWRRSSEGRRRSLQRSAPNRGPPTTRPHGRSDCCRAPARRSAATPAAAIVQAWLHLIALPAPST